MHEHHSNSVIADKLSFLASVALIPCIDMHDLKVRSLFLFNSLCKQTWHSDQNTKGNRSVAKSKNKFLLFKRNSTL